jgi:hypothetical protein
MQLNLLPRRKKHQDYYFYVILLRVRGPRPRNGGEQVDVTKRKDKAEGQSGTRWSPTQFSQETLAPSRIPRVLYTP